MKFSKAEGKMVDFGLERAFLELRGIIRDPAKLENQCRNMAENGHRKTYFAKVTAGGRVTIPARLRKELGIKDDFVAMELYGNRSDEASLQPVFARLRKEGKDTSELPPDVKISVSKRIILTDDILRLMWMIRRTVKGAGSDKQIIRIALVCYLKSLRDG